MTEKHPTEPPLVAKPRTTPNMPEKKEDDISNLPPLPEKVATQQESRPQGVQRRPIIPGSEPVADSTPSAPVPTPPKEQTTKTKPRFSHEIDYTINGDDIQYVEISVDPGESVISEPGLLMYMDQGMQMKTTMGDGSDKHSGVMGALLGAGKRAVTGEKIFITFFTNNSNKRQQIAFASPYPGEIIPLDLGQLGPVLCQKDGFLCGAKGTAVGVGFTKRIGAGMFGGEGYILQKIEGDGMAFIHAGGSTKMRELKPDETIYVDTGSVVAFQKTVDFNVSLVQGVANMMFGGEDLFMTTMKGPGKVWIQSMPFPRLVQTIKQTILATQTKKDLKRAKQGK